MSIFDAYVAGINRAPEIITKEVILKVLKKLANGHSLDEKVTGWYDEEAIAPNIEDIIGGAEKDVLILMDNPSLLAKKKVRSSFYKERTVYPDMKLVLRKKPEDYELDPEICKFESNYKGKTEIFLVNKELIENDSLKHDTFIIADKKNVFWGKPEYDKAEYTKDVSFLASQLYSRINRLVELRIKK